MKFLKICSIAISIAACAISVFAATPLEIAASSGDQGKVKSLIESGAVVNAVDPDSAWENTPLIAAVKSRKVETVKLLLEEGADTEYMNAADQTALVIAADKGYFEIVEALLAAGANPNNGADEYERSPFVWAVLKADLGKTKDYIKVIELLHGAGANCQKTFLHPFGEGDVVVLESAKEAGRKFTKAYLKLCPTGE